MMLTEFKSDTDATIVDSVMIDGVKQREWHATTEIGKNNVKVKVDTGASNVISLSTYETLCKDVLRHHTTRLEPYGGNTLTVNGKWCCVADYGKKLHVLEFVVVREAAAESCRFMHDPTN